MKSRRVLHLIVVGMALMSIAAPAGACLWTYGTDPHGDRIEVGGHFGEPYVERTLKAELRHAAAHDWAAEIAAYEALDAAARDYKAMSDYAVALLRVGRIDEAIEALEAAEAAQPGEYIIASNLGTAYEMAGRNDDALEWINIGLERNAAAHYGTEWVHVAILKAKQKLDADPEWLQSNSVLGFEGATRADPPSPIDDVSPTGKSVQEQLEDLAHDIEYQLQERISLVPPEDPIVAAVLRDLATVVMHWRSMEDAVAVLEFAETYDPGHPITARRLAHAREVVAMNEDSGEASRRTPWPVIVAIGVLGVALGLFLVRAVRASRAAAREASASS